MFQRNLPGWERVIRILAGAGIAAYAILALPGAFSGYALLVAGTMLVLTGLLVGVPCARPAAGNYGTGKTPADRGGATWLAVHRDPARVSAFDATRARLGNRSDVELRLDAPRRSIRCPTSIVRLWSCEISTR